MPENDLDLLVDAARAAGEIALPYWRNAPKEWDKGDGAGPVTEADIAVNDALMNQLRAARPDYGWLSEESEDSAGRLDHDRVFIVDPIDGTRAFIAGDRSWSHSLAVAEKGKIIAGVVFLPVAGKMYSARASEGAWLDGMPITASRRDDLSDAGVLCARNMLAPALWPRGVPPVKRHFRPSLAYRLALVAEGRFDAMLTLRDTWEWDVAAGSLIAREAGAAVTDRLGNPLEFNRPLPKLPGILAAPDPIHAALRCQLD